MLFSSVAPAAALLSLFIPSTSAVPANSPRTPKCRFALEYSQKDILRNPDKFTQDLLFWEGKFHQNNIGINTANGMTYDGTLLNQTTGIATTKHPFSAASKESLHMMVFAQAISGSSDAARFLSPNKPSAAPQIAVDILTTKLETYLKFNETYPGFGGLLPWFTASSQEISPTWDWVNRIPALDNGELIWAVYGVVRALEKSPNKSYQKLGKRWEQWLDYTKVTVKKLWYQGNGKVAAVTGMTDQTLAPNDPKQVYTNQDPTYLLDDPYEGELITWWLHFFGGLSEEEKLQMWKIKRAKLESVEYNQGGIGPITVQKGYWFSSHEQWKVLEMPYHDVSLIHRLDMNAERVRTCNSVVTHNPGMFASVNNSTDPVTGSIYGYVSNAGIPSVSWQTTFELDVITPYSVYPTVYLNKAVGLAWWRNIVAGKKMQNPYGSTESTRIDGTLISSFVSWDSKITTVVALLGGVQDLVREGLKRDGKYNEFIEVANREWSRVFKDLKGEDIDFCLPNVKVPDVGLVDYTECN